MTLDSSDEPADAYLNEMEVARLAVSGWFSRALAVAAQLRIADLTADQVLSHKEIAEKTSSDPKVMLRLMQVLKFCGVFERDDAGRYALSEKFAPLRGDHPWSMRNYCMLMAETYDDAFAALHETVHTGTSGFRSVFGKDLYQYLEENPERSAIFDRAMMELSRPVAATLARQRDFSGATTVIDVGGGGAAMLAGLLAVHPHLDGVCVDRPSVCERGPEELVTLGGREVRSRVRFEAADIFERVPRGGDIYLLKNVLHDWTFESGLRILNAVREAIQCTADCSLRSPRLLVLEPLIEQDSDAARALFQMVACEEGTVGFEERDLRELLRESGFSVVAVDRLVSGHSVFECSVDAHDIDSSGA